MISPIIQSSNRAITLVELLVVIAIVAVLTSLLFSVGPRMIQRGQEARCAANLKQIGIAIQLYAGDHNSEIVPWRLANSADQYWTAFLLPYLGAEFTWSDPPDKSKSSVFMCPTKKANASGATEYKSGNIWSRYNINLHIAENSEDTDAGQPWSQFQKTRMSQSQLSKTYIVMDLFGDGGGGFWCTTDGELTYPHAERVNVLFLDNHIEALDNARMTFLGTKPYHVFWRGYDWKNDGSYSEE